MEEGAAAERAADGVRRFGHRYRFRLKTNNEASILALRSLVFGHFGVLAFEVEPQPYESQSNRAMENGVKLFKGLLRVHILAFKRKLGHRILSKRALRRGSEEEL